MVQAAPLTKTSKKPTASVAAPKFGASRAVLTAANAPRPGAAGAPVSDPSTSIRHSGVTLIASEGSADLPGSKAAPAGDAAGASSGTAQPATAGRVLSEIKSSVGSNSAGTAGAAGAAAPRRPSGSSPARPVAERLDATRKKLPSKGLQPAAAQRKSSASVEAAGKAKADRPASSTTAPVSAAPRRRSSTRPPGSPVRTASPSRPRSRQPETAAPSGMAVDLHAEAISCSSILQCSSATCIVAWSLQKCICSRCSRSHLSWGQGSRSDRAYWRDTKSRWRHRTCSYSTPPLHSGERGHHSGGSAACGSGSSSSICISISSTQQGVGLHCFCCTCVHKLW